MGYLDWTNLFNMLSEFVLALCGVICISTAFRALKNKEAKYGTFVFWLFLGLIFIFGGFVNNVDGTLTNKPIPPYVIGIMLVIMAILSAAKQVRLGVFNESTEEERQSNAKRLGNLIFIPAVLIGIVALALSLISFNVEGQKMVLTPTLSIGGAGLIALLVAIWIAKPKMKETKSDTEKLLMQVGATSILPQLLTALGTVFTTAGVGTVIAGIMGNIIPEGNYFLGVVFYLLGMVLFTMIMGNAFAAFSVITVGIGIPFVISQGGDPALVGTLALTGGYCGTLITPMAANFNIIPTSILEIKDRYKVIKTQLPVAAVMFVIHVFLMYFLTR